MPLPPHRVGSRRLLLCDEGDPVARWLAGALAARGTPIEVVTSSQLVHADRWAHNVTSTGTDLEIDLADGRTVVADELAGVVNRLVTVPTEGLGAAPGDLDYARAELHALWLSWLAGLPCPVLNRPTPYGLSGVWLSEPEWVVHAGRAGLPTVPVRFDSGGPGPMHDDSAASATDGQVPGGWGAATVPLLVVAGAVFGPPGAAPLVDGVRELARSVGADLLEVRLRPRGGDGLGVVGATTLPDLRLGGGRLVDHLAGAVG